MSLIQRLFCELTETSTIAEVISFVAELIMALGDVVLLGVEVEQCLVFPSSVYDNIIISQNISKLYTGSHLIETVCEVTVLTFDMILPMNQG